MTDTLRVSYSSLGTFSSCARKFEFDKLYPKRARVWEDNYAADVGSALHAGYQSYLTHGDEEQAVWAFMQKFPYEEEYSQSNDYRSFEAALSTLEEMFHHVKMEEYELAQIMRPATKEELESDPNTLTYQTAAIEVPFEIRFKGLRIPSCAAFPDGAGISVTGYIDAVMKHHMTDLYRTLDIKTSRMNLQDSTGKYKFDTQQVPYGIVVDHVAQGEVEEFEVLYLDCYIDLLEPQVTLYPFKKSQTDIQEWCTTKILQFQQIAKYASIDYFPRTDNGCLFYNKPCRYLEPCQSREREALNEWFLLGEEPANQDEFQPWIIADVDIGEE